MLLPSGCSLWIPGGLWMVTVLSWISIFRFPFSGPVPASHLCVRHSHCMQHTGNPPCSPCLMYTAWHRESLKLKEKFGTREGFEICPNQFFQPLIFSPSGTSPAPHVQPPGTTVSTPGPDGHHTRIQVTVVWCPSRLPQLKVFFGPCDFPLISDSSWAKRWFPP